MTSEEAIKMLKTEKACVERQGRKQNCNRYCESCDLCMPIEDVIEGYNYAIRALKNEQTDGDLITEIDKLPRIKVGNSNSPTVKYCIDERLIYEVFEKHISRKENE